MTDYEGFTITKAQLEDKTPWAPEPFVEPEWPWGAAWHPVKREKWPRKLKRRVRGWELEVGLLRAFKAYHDETKRSFFQLFSARVRGET